MKKTYTKISHLNGLRKVLGVLSFCFFASLAIGQTQVNTTHIDNNGSGTVTFNIQNTNSYDVIVTEFRNWSQSTGTSTVLYNPVPTTNTGTWSAGTIDAGQNGWLLVGNGTPANTNSVSPILTNANFTIPAGATYQFAVSQSSIGYMTLTAGAGVNTFSAGGVNILTGDGISWGGSTLPSTPSNYPRGFVGGITFIPAVPCTSPPTAGGVAATENPVCSTATSNLTLTGGTGGTGQTHQWQSSATGAVGSWSDIAGATMSFYPATQSADTYYRCYVTCGGLSDTTAGFLLVTDSFLNCYCTSAATSAIYQDIIGVSISNLNNTSTCGTGGGPGSTASYYSDYTNVTPALTVPNLQQGISYPMDVDLGTCTSGNNNMTKVFIDYNHDGDFYGVGEEVYVSSAATNGAHTESFNVLIPMTANAGLTRMRIVNNGTTNASTINPCGTYSYGETEDYIINISVPIQNDAGVSEFVTPLLPTCDFSDSVRVSLTNYGTDTLTSATVNWFWNGTAQTPLNWTGSIAPLDSLTVTLGWVALASGNSLQAYTTMPNGVTELTSGAWNDTSSISNLLAGLSGVYTIGGLTPDFADFNSAANALITFGICGNVIFDVRDGIYNEQLQLPSLASSDSVHTVTFRSENGDTSLVKLTFASNGAGNNYVVKFFENEYFNFENITMENTGTTFSNVIFFEGGSEYNRIEGCRLVSSIGSTSTSNSRAVIWSSAGEDNYNTFKNNTVEGGSYGAYWYGPSTTVHEKGNVFEGNNFMSNYYRGLNLYYGDELVVKDNNFGGTSAYTSRRAMYLYYTNGAPVITGNTIYSENTSGHLYGIYMSNVGGNSVKSGLIANNMIQAGRPGSTSTHYGIYMTNVGYMDVYNNSVLTSEGGASTRSLYVTGGGAINLKNNIFATNTAGYALYISGAFSLTNSDNNVLYAPSGNVGYLGGNLQTLNDWQSSTGFDANSLSINPMFHSDNNLHVCNDSIGNQGSPISAILTDIDGQLRDALNPDMGADEFSGITGSFLGADLDICAGDSVQIWAGAPTDTVLWSTGATTSSIWVSTPGNYSVTLLGACGTGNDAITVNPSALTYSNFIQADTLEFCQGDVVELTSSIPGSSYAWGGAVTSTNDTVQATIGGNYTLSMSDNCGSGIDAITLVMNTVPVVSFTSSTSFLTGTFTSAVTGGAGMTYAWDFGDGSTSTDANPIHVYSSTGTFTVTLTVTNSCGTTTFTDTVSSWQLGIEEIENFGSLNIYPNPSTGLFQVEMDLIKAMDLDVVVTNVMGQKISVQSLSTVNGAQSETIDLSSEANGVYYVNISSNGEQLSNRMIVKK